MNESVISRQIRFTGMQNPLTIYGCFSPEVERALNDGWLSVGEIASLHKKNNTTVPHDYTHRDYLFWILTARKAPRNMPPKEDSTWSIADRYNLGWNLTEAQKARGLLAYVPTDKLPSTTSYLRYKAMAITYGRSAKRFLQDPDWRRNSSTTQVINRRLNTLNNTTAAIGFDRTIAPDDKDSLIRVMTVMNRIRNGQPSVLTPAQVTQFSNPEDQQVEQFNYLVTLCS